MAKKGGSSSQQPQQTTVTNTTLPAYAQPYVTDVMSRAQGIASRPYEAYSGARIAPFAQDQLQAFDVARDAPNAGQTQFNQADNLTGIAAINAQNSGYNPGAISADQVSTGTWDNAAAQQYMSPYLTNVLDAITARQADSFSRAQLERDAQAKKAGVFGGYRQGVESAVARGQHELNLGDLVSQTLNQGWNNAQQMFTSDQGRSLTADTSNQRANLEASMANEGNALKAAQQKLSMAQGIGALGAQQGALGAQRADTQLKGLEALRSTGLDQQRQTQASLDQAYTDFQNQRDYERTNLTWLNNTIRGNVTGTNSNTVTTEASNPYTQMLGLGVGAVGLANALTGGQGGQG